MSGPIRVIVADDQDIVRDGLVTVLALLDDIDVLAAARDGREAVDLCRRLHPDVVLMDLRMPVLGGADATAQILAEQPSVAVLVLTTYDDDASIAAALRAGARGYLTKDASREDVAVALRAVARGQATFDPGVSARIISGLPAATATGGTDQAGPAPAGPARLDPDAAGSSEERSRRTPDPRLAGLTAREREVLALIGDGLSNGEIAERLFVSASTVKTHINNVFAKCDLRDRAHAVRLALELFGR